MGAVHGPRRQRIWHLGSGLVNAPLQGSGSVRSADLEGDIRRGWRAGTLPSPVRGLFTSTACLRLLLRWHEYHAPRPCPLRDLPLKQFVAAMQVQRDLVRLPLGARRRGVSSEIARRSQQEMSGFGRAPPEVLFGPGRFGGLDRVEITIFTQHGLAQHRQQAIVTPVFGQIAGHQFCCFVDLVLPVQEGQLAIQQHLRR